MRRATNSKLSNDKIMKTDKTTPRIPIENIEVGKTYQTYTRDIVKVMDINNTLDIMTLKNISQTCTQRFTFRNIYFVKEF